VNRRFWIIIGALFVLLAGLLFYGIHTGDADYVYKNATNFCFT